MATVHHQSVAKTCEPKFIQSFPPECREDLSPHSETSPAFPGGANGLRPRVSERRGPRKPQCGGNRNPGMSAARLNPDPRRSLAGGPVRPLIHPLLRPPPRLYLQVTLCLADQQRPFRMTLPRPAQLSCIIWARKSSHHAKWCLTKGDSYSLSKLRVVVDYVDDERLHPVIESENSHKPKTEATEAENSSSRENPMARIKRFQIEADRRKIEFARLLEEHAQVIRRLKQMEETESTLHFSNAITNVSKA